MNLANAVLPSGTLDPEAFGRARADSVRNPAASVCVRQFDARTRQHVLLWEGPMRLDHISALAAGKPAIGVD